MQNGDYAVAMINTGDEATDITLLLSDVVCTSCPRKATVVDVWAGVDELGSYGLSTATSSSYAHDTSRDTTTQGSEADQQQVGGRLRTVGAVAVEESYTAKAVEKHETILLRLTPMA